MTMFREPGLVSGSDRPASGRFREVPARVARHWSCRRRVRGADSEHPQSYILSVLGCRQWIRMRTYWRVAAFW